jgi:formylglycine-generating enzyme required for sulfatase activity
VVVDAPRADRAALADHWLLDMSVLDQPLADQQLPDLGAFDQPTADTMPLDAGTADHPPLDMSPLDQRLADQANPDRAAPDHVSADTLRPDTLRPDTLRPDLYLGDVGPVDPGSTFPSCTALLASCGPKGTDSCCTSLWVPGGTYYRSYDVAADGMYSSTAYPATVSSFYLDKYLVTVGRFRAFVNAGMGIDTPSGKPAAGAGANPYLAGSGWDPSWDASLAPSTATLESNLNCNATWQTWTNAAGSNEELPINCVTWYEAMAFCAWDGGFLPTEAEWNYAAAGGNEQRAYPWSNPAGSLAIDCTDANYYGTSYCVSSGANKVGSESPTGDGRWGQSDLGGNLYEWNLDSMAAPYTTYPYSIGSCTDCADLSASGYKVFRGGEFADAGLRTANRSFADPAILFDGVGVRCARAR